VSVANLSILAGDTPATTVRPMSASVHLLWWQPCRLRVRVFCRGNRVGCKTSRFSRATRPPLQVSGAAGDTPAATATLLLGVFV